MILNICRCMYGKKIGLFATTNAQKSDKGMTAVFMNVILEFYVCHISFNFM